MPRLSLYRRDKSNDFNFLDHSIKEQFLIGGTACLIYKYKGPENVGDQNDSSQPIHTNPSEINIQDFLLLENRDRKYDTNIYELRGVYNVTDNDFDLSQFGFFLTADNLFISFHMNDMVDKIGRKLMSGDVIELPHLRDDLLLDESLGAINKFYVVEDANRSSEGFSQTWYPHIWRVKVGPLTDAQEFQDVIENNDDVLSTYTSEIAVNAAIEKGAEDSYDGYLKTDNLYGYDHDGYGVTAITKGTYFPENPVEGQTFLRTDFSPPRVYTRKASVWEFTRLG